MAGFFSNLFGRKDNGSDQPKDAFYLESDEAKSMGNLDYMRTPNTIRRTFPKSASSPQHKELVTSITAMDKTTVKAVGMAAPDKATAPAPNYNSYVISSNTAPTSAPSASAPASAPVASEVPASEPAPRRSGNDGMDMFRSMAKNLGR